MTGERVVKTTAPLTHHPPVPLDQIKFVDFPTITFNKHESIEMPFREFSLPCPTHTRVGYVTDANGDPILPPGMKDHLKADLNRTIDDF